MDTPGNNRELETCMMFAQNLPHISGVNRPSLIAQSSFAELSIASREEALAGIKLTRVPAGLSGYLQQIDKKIENKRVRGHSLKEVIVKSPTYRTTRRIVIKVRAAA